MPPPPCLSRALRRWSAGSCQSQRTQPGFSHPMSSSTFEPSCSASLRCGHRPGLRFWGPWFHNPAQICGKRRLWWDQKIFLCPDGDRVWCWKLCCTTGFGLKMFHGNLLFGAPKIQSKRRLWPCRLRCHRPASHPNGVQHDTALMTFCKLIWSLDTLQLPSTSVTLRKELPLLSFVGWHFSDKVPGWMFLIGCVKCSKK